MDQQQHHIISPLGPEDRTATTTPTMPRHLDSLTSSRPTLYHVKRTISSPIVQLILELGLHHHGIHIQEITFADLKRPEYLQINPMGTSPAFTDGSLVLWESGAILEHLLETYDVRHTYHVPPGTPLQRPKYLQLKQYLIATVYPMIAKWYLHTISSSQRPEYQEDTVTRDTVRNVIGPYLVRALGSSKYFMGDQLTVIDFLAAKPLTNLHSMGELARFPTLQAHWEHISSMASYKEAYEGLLKHSTTLTPTNGDTSLLDCASSFVKTNNQRLVNWTAIQPNIMS